MELKCVKWGNSYALLPAGNTMHDTPFFVISKRPFAVHGKVAYAK